MTAPMNCQLVGRWRIVEADLWDRDHLDLVEPAMMTIRADGHGEIAFGAMQASLDLEYSRSMVFFTNTALGVWADSAYRSAEIEAALKEKGLRSRIHRKGRRNKPLSEREKQGNKTRSSVRVRVEHVFGAQSNDMGGTLVRSVGLVRAKARIGLKNLAYNMRRLVQLERLAAAV